MDNANPARIYALVIGATLVIAGIVGFFYSADFTSDEAVHEDVFGVLAVNGWHNVVHIATGMLGLLAVGYAARAYALILGIVYIAVAAWGFIIGSGESILSIVPVNLEDNVLHLAIGGLGVVAGLATPAAGAVAAGPPPSEPAAS